MEKSPENNPRDFKEVVNGSQLDCALMVYIYVKHYLP